MLGQNGQHEEYWFLYRGNELLIKLEAEKLTIPTAKDIWSLGIEPKAFLELGTWLQTPCFVGEVEVTTPLSQPFAFMGLRAIMGQVKDDVFVKAGGGYNLIHWNRTHRYCGQCGTPTVDKEDERAKQCPNCGLINYPSISPAVIVAIIKDDQILLARNKKFVNNTYSVISGFVEPGETVEECVKREIREEVGIEVKNLSYFGSQPWPFPDALMLGFFAEYAAGEIKVDHVEIVDAKWFTVDKIPNFPPQGTIAKELVDWFCAGERSN